MPKELSGGDIEAVRARIGAAATALYGLFVEQGSARTDFSGIIRFLRGPEAAQKKTASTEETTNH